MVVLIEVIGNWVAWSVVLYGCFMVVDWKSDFCTRFTYIMALSVTFLHVIKYTTLDELRLSN